MENEIVAFVRERYRQSGVVPSVRELLKHFGLRSTGTLYRRVPGGLRGICREAGVPFPEERLKVVARARGRRARLKEGSSEESVATHADIAPDLEKTVFRELRRGADPAKIIETHGHADVVLRLVEMFRDLQRPGLEAKLQSLELEKSDLRARVETLGSRLAEYEPPMVAVFDRRTNLLTLPGTINVAGSVTCSVTVTVDFSKVMGYTAVLWNEQEGGELWRQKVTPEFVKDAVLRYFG